MLNGIEILVKKNFECQIFTEPIAMHSGIALLMKDTCDATLEFGHKHRFLRRKYFGTAFALGAHL